MSEDTERPPILIETAFEAKPLTSLAKPEAQKVLDDDSSKFLLFFSSSVFGLSGPM